MSTPEPAATALLVIELGDALYALDRSVVREIVPIGAATRLPGAPAHVRGVVNLRGQLLTVIDLASRLTGVPVRNAEGTTIVVQSGERALGLNVDEVRDVQAIELGGADGMPYQPAAQGLIRGMGRLEEGVVLVLDVDEIVRQTLA